METIENRILDLVAREFALDRKCVHLGLNLREIGDSLDWFSFVAALEDAFGVEIHDEETRHLRSVGDLLDLVAAKEVQ